MASRTGFEPVAYGLGNRCSILLSYRDIATGTVPGFIAKMNGPRLFS